MTVKELLDVYEGSLFFNLIIGEIKMSTSILDTTKHTFNGILKCDVITMELDYDETQSREVLSITIEKRGNNHAK